MEDEDDEEDYSSSGTESDDIDALDLARPHERGESASEDGSSDEDSDDAVNVEFEFFDPRTDDYKSVRRLLEHYLPGEETTFAVSEMADAVVEQQALGTMVKVVDDPDVYAFETILPVNKYRVRVQGWSFCQARSVQAARARTGRMAAALSHMPLRRSHRSAPCACRTRPG